MNYKYSALLSLFICVYTMGAVAQKVEDSYLAWCSDVSQLSDQDIYYVRSIVKDALATAIIAVPVAQEVQALIEEMDYGAMTRRERGIKDPYLVIELVGSQRGLWDRLHNVWDSLSGNARYLLARLRDLIYGRQAEHELLSAEEQALPDLERWQKKMERCCQMLDDLLEEK